MNDDVSASFLDKTDWRVTLHRKLEACVDAEGTVYYRRRVKSLISAASAQYPGWNAEKEIKDYIIICENEYNKLWDDWLENNLTKSKWQKYNYNKHLDYMIHRDIFTFIKNMCARKRMLLWGSKSIPGGTQMEYDE